MIKRNLEGLTSTMIEQRLLSRACMKYQSAGKDGDMQADAIHSPAAETPEDGPALVEIDRRPAEKANGREPLSEQQLNGGHRYMSLAQSMS